MHNVADRDYKSKETTAHSGRKIGRILEEDPNRCREKWKQLRDKFARLKKRIKTKSRDPGPPAHSLMLSWLEGFVKLWEAQGNVNDAAAEVRKLHPDLEHVYICRELCTRSLLTHKHTLLPHFELTIITSVLTQTHISK